MPNTKNKLTSTKNQVKNVSRFIPSKTFDSFGTVLNSIQQETGLLNNGEKKILNNLAYRSYLNGKIYPKQSTIAYDVGLTKNHVCMVLNGLEKKGFLQIDHATQGMKSQGRNNNYHFIMHPVYNDFESYSDKIVSDIITQNQFLPFNVLNNKKPLSGTIFPNEKQTKQELKELCQQIESKCQNLSKSFNIQAFTNQHLKKYPVQALTEALQVVLTKMKACNTNEILNAIDWWPYSSQIIKRIGGNMNESLSIQEHQQIKKQAVPLEFKNLRCIRELSLF
jgi:hypothetical protein